MSETKFDDIRAALGGEVERLQSQVDETVALLREQKARLKGVRGALDRLSPQPIVALTLGQVVEHYQEAQRQNPGAGIEVIRERVKDRVRSSGASLSGIGLLRKRAEAALRDRNEASS